MRECVSENSVTAQRRNTELRLEDDLPLVFALIHTEESNGKTTLVPHSVKNIKQEGGTHDPPAHWNALHMRPDAQNVREFFAARPSCPQNPCVESRGPRCENDQALTPPQQLFAPQINGTHLCQTCIRAPQTHAPEDSRSGHRELIDHCARYVLAHAILRREHEAVHVVIDCRLWLAKKVIPLQHSQEGPPFEKHPAADRHVHGPPLETQEIGCQIARLGWPQRSHGDLPTVPHLATRGPPTYEKNALRTERVSSFLPFVQRTRIFDLYKALCSAVRPDGERLPPPPARSKPNKPHATTSRFRRPRRHGVGLMGQQVRRGVALVRI